MSHHRSPMRSTQRWAARMLVMLAVIALAGAMAAPASSGVAAPTAQTTSALTSQERADLPAGARKVTRAGLVHGTIPAQVGDIVLAATVLHGSDTDVFEGGGTGPGGAPVRLRVQSAIEENASNEVRGYWRFRLVYGDTFDNTWSTYHRGAVLRVHRDDRGTNQADGCLAYPNHCTWDRNPPDCRGPGPTCDYYIQTSLYRPKGDAADWWFTEFGNYEFWHPNRNGWYSVRHCSQFDTWWLRQEVWWEVGLQTRAPAQCPEDVGN
jgi:hypothetical protein